MNSQGDYYTLIFMQWILHCV